MLSGQDLNQLLIAFASRLTGSPQSLTRNYYFDPFTYEIDFITSTTKLPALGSVIGSFNVQNDSAFAIVKKCYIFTTTSTTSTTGQQPFGSGVDLGFAPFTVQEFDSGSGRIMSNAAVPVDSCFGLGREPFELTVPKILDPNSTFQVTLANLVNTDWYVRLSFIGYKVFGDINAFINIAKGAGPINY